MPHGYCLSWNPQLVWLFVIGNSLVTLSYYSIPAAFALLVLKRRDLIFNWMVLLFAAFIFACGTTHLVKIWTIWHPAYWFEASLDAFTGVLSMFTAILLWRMVPKLLALPTHAQMKEANQALKEQIEQTEQAELKFRFFLEAAPDAMVIMDQEGKMILVNSQTEKIFGYNRKELLGQHVEMLIPTHFDHGVAERHASFFAVGGSGDPSMGPGIELYASRKNGTEFPVEISLSPLETADGLLVSSAIRDITERKRAEQKFRQLLESAPDAMVIVDQTGTIVLVNSQLEILFGRRREELLGHPVDMLIPVHKNGAGKGEKALYFTDTFTPEMGEGMGLYGIRNDNTKFPVEISSRPLHTDDGVLISSAIRDVSQRREVEEKQRVMSEKISQSNQELQEFAYIVSHDLQEPLRAISTFSDMLDSSCRSKLTEQESEFLTIIIDANHRMQQLITDLLAYSRIERTGAKSVLVDSTMVVEQALTNLQISVDESGAVITVDALPQVFADQIQLRQLFQNLVGNAIKYRGINSPRVKISCQRRGEEWLFSVKDNGIGFDMKFADRIFEPFQRLHAGSKYPGTGIGLAICRKIIERLGGKIWAESLAGKNNGSTFFFTIPTNPLLTDLQAEQSHSQAH